MVATALLLGFLLAATLTDVRSRRIYNWTTYPGIIVALAGSALASVLAIDDVQGSASDGAVWGFVPFSDAAAGFLGCGIAMLVCYVFFPGGVGGGDVKLIAMMGAFLGFSSGLEAMLWTFILGACQALITLIWRRGAIQMLRRAAAQFAYLIRVRGHVASRAPQDRSPGIRMFLSPSALVSAVLVRFHLADWM